MASIEKNRGHVSENENGDEMQGVTTDSQSTQGQDNQEPAHKKSSKVGEDVDICPSVLAKVRKMEKFSPSGILGTFYALTASANKLLPGKPLTLSKPKKPSTETSKAAADRDNAAKCSEKFEGKGDEKREYKRAGTSERRNDDQSKDDDEFYCSLCDAQTNSPLTWDTHVQGKKHQKRLIASRLEWGAEEQYRPEDGPPVRSVVKKDRTPKIQTQIDLTSSPIVGLDYVSEIWRLDAGSEIMYYCKLCDSTCQKTTVVSHVLGFKHRSYYLKMTKTSKYEDIKAMNAKKSELSKIVERETKKLEGLDGRGKIVVEQEVERTPSPEIRLDQEMPEQEPVSHRNDESELLTEFEIEKVRSLSSDIRIKLLKELVDISPDDLKSSMDASRLDYVIENFKKSISEYRNKKKNMAAAAAWWESAAGMAAGPVDQMMYSDMSNSMYGRSNFGTSSVEGYGSNSRIAAATAYNADPRIYANHTSTAGQFFGSSMHDQARAFNMANSNMTPRGSQGGPISPMIQSPRGYFYDNRSQNPASTYGEDGVWGPVRSRSMGYPTPVYGPGQGGFGN